MQKETKVQLGENHTGPTRQPRLPDGAESLEEDVCSSSDNEDPPGRLPDGAKCSGELELIVHPQTLGAINGWKARQHTPPESQHLLKRDCGSVIAWVIDAAA
eukprot:GHVU01172491.1.p2 GENE.GHVU01172491.1~~GHVU01172491.1.p2  ORF type:complete len:102 (+),score=12.43 GHVU01172491.1:168-473(+)